MWPTGAQHSVTGPPHLEAEHGGTGADAVEVFGHLQRQGSRGSPPLGSSAVHSLRARLRANLVPVGAEGGADDDGDRRVARLLQPGHLHDTHLQKTGWVTPCATPVEARGARTRPHAGREAANGPRSRRGGSGRLCPVPAACRPQIRHFGALCEPSWPWSLCGVAVAGAPPEGRRGHWLLSVPPRVLSASTQASRLQYAAATGMQRSAACVQVQCTVRCLNYMASLSSAPVPRCSAAARCLGVQGGYGARGRRRLRC